ncbi:hypothetical protein E1264_18605 [Actinomadura sp. KC216]|uniref:SCP2 sterol-binding domain-containing protein n=1 Tax=Actinomadura sp. KC216 TaxID=2530370 RepID=UPI00104418A2|nr:SCP2 sterol-binding domain-containing protein [Actinomadura sp. KC216]TDB86230.1 hypothetical protein E1264_18605 [Actinomadura sp. KC216]
MPVFPSAEWLDEYVRCMNTSEEFADAARTFEADITYVFEADQEKGLPKDIWCRADFAGGMCRWAKFDISPEEGAGSQFTIRAPYTVWKDVIQGRIDPMEGMLDGDLLVTGHLPTLLRYVRAANELVTLSAAVSSSFIDD